MRARLDMSRPKSGRARETQLLLAMVVLVLAGPGSAAEIEGVTFSDAITFSEPVDQTLELNGMGLFRYRILFRAYVAALYLPAGVPGTRALEDVSRRLELNYFWPIASVDLTRAADHFLEAQLGREALLPLRERISTLHRAYRDVAPQDRYSLTYFPGVGTELALNGESLATIPGADFARAYFAIWLGARPLDEALRDGLLGRTPR